MDSDFTRLDRLLTLAETARMNAAKCVWDNLSLDFKVKVMRFVRELIPYTGDFSEYAEGIRIDSTHGEFVLNSLFLKRLLLLIPQVVAHGG